MVETIKRDIEKGISLL